MDLQIADVDFLLEKRAQEGLHWLDQQSRNPRERLALTGRLRKTFSPREGSLLLEQWELQENARQRQIFRDPNGLLLERSALQQATHWKVAEHRAAQLRARIGGGEVAELGCGIGGDTLELARGGPVHAFEIDPARARMAQHNTRATITCGDFFDSQAEGAAALFVDPARRRDDRRVFDPEQYQPPLSQVVALRDRYPLICVKAGPGIADEHLPPDCELEFISHDRTCKEAVLWLYAGARGRRASVLTAQGWLAMEASEVEGPGIFEVGGWIHEPDPALLRAHALGTLATELEAGWLDPKIGYLVGRAAKTHPLVHSFEILDILPLHTKQIVKRLQELQLWPLEIKKRGVDIEPEEYRKQLKIKASQGSRPGVLLLTRRHDDHLAILAQRGERGTPITP